MHVYIMEIGRVKCWFSTEGLRQKEVLDRETGMVYIVNNNINYV